MSEGSTEKPKKKSVALSGVQAGTTAVCTVGHSGNDLHYRGYDILELAEKSNFEETAYLLVHGDLPTAAQLAAYRQKLAGLRDLPANVRGQGGAGEPLRGRSGQRRGTKTHRAVGGSYKTPAYCSGLKTAPMSRAPCRTRTTSIPSSSGR